MVRNYTVIFALVIAALVHSSESGVVPANNNLTFLGKFTKTSVETGSDDKRTQKSSYYYFSQNAAAWSTSASDCKAFLGNTASLANIETAEELEVVNRLLQSSDGTGSTYWLGGKFDTDSSTFVWDNGVEIISSAPWSQGHPTTRTPVTRVLAYTVGGLRLRTDFSTVSLRYLCELIG